MNNQTISTEMEEKINQARERVLKESTYSKNKSDKHGEVFTPTELINEMLDKLPKEVWSDRTKTFFDPCAGKGNFGIEIVDRLYKGLESSIPNEKERLQHIVENQLYMSELQEDSCRVIREVFSFGEGYKVNLHEGNTLEMPEDYFDR